MFRFLFAAWPWGHCREAHYDVGKAIRTKHHNEPRNTTNHETQGVSMSVRWGIIGTGGIAHVFVSDLMAAGFTVTAVGSRRADKARDFAQQYGIPHAHGSYAELVADPEVDAIYVATPHPMHVTDATLALSAGKHVLVEKPFTLNAADAASIVDLAAAQGLVVLEAMWTRFLPHMVRLRELIADGVIGEVRTVIADHNQSLPTDPQHRLQNPDLGGGALLDLGIYPVSFAWDMLGEPSSVMAISSPTPTGVDRQTAILLGYENGQQAVLHTALDTAGPNTAVVIGSKGWVAIDSVFYTPTTFTVFATDGSVIERFDGRGDGSGKQFEAWELERRVTEGVSADTVLPPSETVSIMRTLDEVRSQIGLVYPSERDGGVVG
jgi:predicted dehydrogenase